jgi:hypothetical protein
MSRRREDPRQVRERLVARLITAVSTLDPPAAAMALTEIGPRCWAPLDRYLNTNSNALAQPGTDVPVALVRLAHVLIAAGHRDVVAPSCARCGRQRPNLSNTDGSGQRICGTCYAATRVGRCARCGVTRRLAASRAEGVICSACYAKDPQVVRECGSCGRLRKPVARTADSSPRCQVCHARPVHTCSSCGARRTASAITDQGPVCAGCYRAPARRCGRCGQQRPIARRATAEEPDLCYSCYQGKDATCSICDRVRPCQRVGSGRPICRTCRPRPRRPCFRCGRARPVQAEWPAGPVCVGCYEHVRRHPETCPSCRNRRPLIGRDPAGASTCGPCAGVDLTYTCRNCGQAGEIHCDQRCFRCVLTERVTDLLTGPDDQVDEQLQPLLAALRQVDNPATVVAWLTRSRSAKLLRQLAIAGEPITHDLLDRQPQTQPLHYIRDVLVTGGVLPARNEHLARLDAWLEGILSSRPTHHARLVKPFAHWYVLGRARRSATGRHGFTRSAADYARTRITTALDLLAWLDQQHLRVENLTQADPERWLAEGATTRRAVRFFLNWAHDRGIANELQVVLPPRPDPSVLLDDDERVTQLRRCLQDTSLPLELRVAGALMLLFGLLLTRVLQLRASDVISDGENAYLNIDGHRLGLPPRLATLVHRLQNQPRPRWTLARIATDPGWLFPGQSPTRPVHDSAFAKRLQQIGIYPLAGRNRARLALAAELPASVLADLTGLHVSTALRWTRWAMRDWAAFVAIRDTADHGAAGSC